KRIGRYARAARHHAQLAAKHGDVARTHAQTRVCGCCVLLCWCLNEIADCSLLTVPERPRKAGCCRAHRRRLGWRFVVPSPTRITTHWQTGTVADTAFFAQADKMWDFNTRSAMSGTHSIHSLSVQ